MTSIMNIGDFSRATRLSSKALRYYHRIGLLEPVIVDPANGYRFYGVEQIADAQIIRHFRALEMPVDVIAQVVRAEEADQRDELIAEHLRTMERRLNETRDAVTALRALLTKDQQPLVIERRAVEATPAIVIRDVIPLTDLGTWFTQARAALELAVATTGCSLTGPLGGLWSTELFLDEEGEAALYYPVRSIDDISAMGRAQVEVLPAVQLATATHRGSDATIGQVYAGLGEHVARHETGADGPVRESYLDGVPGGHGVTEIGWPVGA